MPQLYVFDADERLQTVIMPDTYFGAQHAEQLNGEQAFQFSLPADHEAAIHVAEGAWVAFRDPDKDFLLFEVRRVVDLHADTVVRTAYCEPAYLELLDEHIEDKRPQNCGAEYALLQALVGTRWATGYVDSFGSKTTNYYRINVLASVRRVVDVWGGELRFRVTLSNTGEVTGRYVDLFAMRGADTGKRFEYRKDISSIERTVDASELKTALYGYGAAEETADGYGRRIDFADVAWSVANGDPADKPLGQTWIGAPDALIAWGRARGTRHRYGQFSNPDITDPAELLAATWAHLQTVNQPLVNYRLTVVDLEQLSGYGHEAVRLGDTVAVIDSDLGIRVTARVIELRRNLTQPEQSVVILGNFLPTLTSDAQRTLALERRVHDREGIWQAKFDGEGYVQEGVSYKSVYIDGDSGLRVLDEQARERVAIGEYAAGKYGLRLMTADGTKAVLDEDGLLDAYQINVSDNLDATHPLVMRVYVPEGVSRVDMMQLVAYADKFRAYQVGAAEAGAESYYAESGSKAQGMYQGAALITPTVIIPSVYSPFSFHRTEIYVFVQNDADNYATLDVRLYANDKYDDMGNISVGPYEVRKFLYTGNVFAGDCGGTDIGLYLKSTTAESIFVRGWLSVSVKTKHQHAPVYGIYESTVPSGIRIKIDGTDRTAALGGPWSGYGEPFALPSLNLASYIQSAGWHTIEFTSTTLGRITAALTCQQFIRYSGA